LTLKLKQKPYQKVIGKMLKYIINV